HSPNPRLNRLDHDRRIAGRSYDEGSGRGLDVGKRPVGVLAVRHEYLRDRIGVATVIPHIAGNANDGEPMLLVLVVEEGDALAHRVRIGPEEAGCGLVDDRTRGSRWPVTLVESTAAPDRYAHDSKEILAHDIERHAMALTRTGVRVALDVKGFMCAAAQER